MTGRPSGGRNCSTSTNCSSSVMATTHTTAVPRTRSANSQPPRSTSRSQRPRPSSRSGVDGPVTGPVSVQCSAHGRARPATIEVRGDIAVVRWDEPQRRVAPGQSVVAYDRADARVLGGGICR